MAILETIKHDFCRLRDGEPGCRFKDFAQERRSRRESKMSAGRVLSLLAGFALIVAGIGIGWLPGPGGFLAIIGLALIAQEIPWVAGVLDAIEIRIRQVIRYVKRIISARTNTAK